jgi:hypothetical protein
VHFHLGAVVEHRRPAAWLHLEHLAVVTRAQEQRSVGAGDGGPDERRAGIVHPRQLRSQHQAAVLVDRQLIDFTAQEVRLRGRLPESWSGRQGRRRQQDHNAYHPRLQAAVPRRRPGDHNGLWIHQG